MEQYPKIQEPDTEQVFLVRWMQSLLLLIVSCFPPSSVADFLSGCSCLRFFPSKNLLQLTDVKLFAEDIAETTYIFL